MWEKEVATTCMTHWSSETGPESIANESDCMGTNENSCFLYVLQVKHWNKLAYSTKDKLTIWNIISR